MEKNCRQCGTITKNKVYCSTTCQHQGAKKIISKRIKALCLKCGNEFEDTEYRIKTLGKKYCSRICKDSHQKELYVGEGNPVSGRVVSEEERKKRSSTQKKIWKRPDHRNKVKAGQQKFKDENGYWPGTDETSKEKRKKSCLEKYGVDHNWKDPQSRKKCEDTCVKKTGLTLIQHAHNAVYSNMETSIEKIIKDILVGQKIKFKKNFHIFINDKEYKIFDFYLPEHNMLIEADGDYWHGNPEYFSVLNEIQTINKQNDKFKESLAKQEGYLLIRFWENQIKNINFKSIFLDIIQHGKKG